MTLAEHCMSNLTFDAVFCIGIDWDSIPASRLHHASVIL